MANRWVIPVLLSLALVACGGDDDGGTEDRDAGRTGIDASVPPGTDASTTPGTDSGTTPGTDSGTTPGTDSGTTPDSGGGSGGTRDPRLETDPDPGQVTCGTATCNVPAQTCCTTLFPQGQSCVAPAMCSGGTSAPGTCDGPEDCSGGQLCCAPSGFSDLTRGTTCETSCGSRFRMCQTDAQCDAGQTCHTCRPPMGMGNVVGLCNAGASCPGSYESL